MSTVANRSAVTADTTIAAATAREECEMEMVERATGFVPAKGSVGEW